jgi:hypothetical protein
MAYTQNPGRGNSSKTGSGIPTPLLQTGKQVIDASDRAKSIVESYKSNKKLTPRDLDIEHAAATDSILAANPDKPYLYTSREKKQMGNKAANNTRKINNSSIRVDKKEVFNSKTGYEDAYNKRSTSPAQMKKTPAKMKKC